MEKDKLVYTKCKRCNRKLRTEKAQERGYGEYCWYLHLKESNKRRKLLFDPSEE